MANGVRPPSMYRMPTASSSSNNNQHDEPESSECAAKAFFANGPEHIESNNEVKALREENQVLRQRLADMEDRYCQQIRALQEQLAQTKSATAAAEQRASQQSPAHAKLNPLGWRNETKSSLPLYIKQHSRPVSVSQPSTPTATANPFQYANNAAQSTVHPCSPAAVSAMRSSAHWGNQPSLGTHPSMQSPRPATDSMSHLLPAESSEVKASNRLISYCTGLISSTIPSLPSTVAPPQTAKVASSWKLFGSSSGSQTDLGADQTPAVQWPEKKSQSRQPILPMTAV